MIKFFYWKKLLDNLLIETHLGKKKWCVRSPNAAPIDEMQRDQIEITILQTVMQLFFFPKFWQLNDMREYFGFFYCFFIDFFN